MVPSWETFILSVVANRQERLVAWFEGNASHIAATMAICTRTRWLRRTRCDCPLPAQPQPQPSADGRQANHAEQFAVALDPAQPALHHLHGVSRPGPRRQSPATGADIRINSISRFFNTAFAQAPLGAVVLARSSDAFLTRRTFDGCASAPVLSIFGLPFYFHAYIDT